MIQIVEFIRNYKATEGYTGSYINNASRTRTFDKIKKVLNLSKKWFLTPYFWKQLPKSGVIKSCLWFYFKDDYSKHN